jgi:putative effector of murein hydrolase
LETAVWTRVLGVLIVSVVYVFLIRRLRARSRSAYRRVTFISAAGLVAILLVLTQSHYPPWMRVEQVLQALVLAGLLWSTQQPDVKRFFAKPVAP